MLPIYKIVDGHLTAVSLVEHPAIEEDFMLFSEQKMNFSFDEEKHIAFGPAMIADMPIYRRSIEKGEYYVVFDAPVIEKLFTEFMQNGKKFTLEHSSDTNDIFLLEAFLKRPGLSPVGYEQVPDGSLFIAVKVNNEALWADLKAGKYNGFSIETTVTANLEEDELTQLIDELTK
mgnify:CR=1 FL=1